MITVVQKPFAGSRQFRSGDIVDSSAWRNEKRLLAGRFLRPATAEEAERLQGDRKGRGNR